jgi:hypothetical protein
MRSHCRSPKGVTQVGAHPEADFRVEASPCRFGPLFCALPRAAAVQNLQLIAATLTSRLDGHGTNVAAGECVAQGTQ